MSDFFDDFNKFGGGGKMPFNPEDFKDKGIKEVLRALAPQVLPFLANLKSPDFNAMISEEAEFMHEDMKDAFEDGSFAAQLEKASDDMRAVSYDKILAEVQKVLSVASKTDDAEKKAEATATLLKDFTEDQYAAVCKALNNAMPPNAREVYNLAATGGKDMEQYAREFFNMTPEQRVALVREESAKIPADVIATAIYEILQKATPERLEVFVREFLDSTTPTDFTEIVFSGLDFAEDLLRTVSRENSFDIKKPARAKQFAENLEILFTAVEESLIKAGLTPDIDVKKEVAAAMKDDPKAKPSTPSIDTADKTPRTKKPSNGDFTF